MIQQNFYQILRQFRSSFKNPVLKETFIKRRQCLLAVLTTITNTLALENSSLLNGIKSNKFIPVGSNEVKCEAKQLAGELSGQVDM